MPECPEHLKDFRWKKGESGNPDGLSKRPSFESVVAKVLDELVPGSDVTKREMLAKVFVTAMLKKNAPLIKEYLARAWPAVQKHEVELPGVSDDALETAIDRFIAGEDEPVPAKPNGSGAAAS